MSDAGSDSDLEGVMEDHVRSVKRRKRKADPSNWVKQKAKTSCQHGEYVHKKIVPALCLSIEVFTCCRAGECEVHFRSILGLGSHDDQSAYIINHMSDFLKIRFLGGVY